MFLDNNLPQTSYLLLYHFKLDQAVRNTFRTKPKW